MNLATEIRVVNATSITGYAKSKADALTQAGYTSVTPSNPTGNVPSQTVVWYQNEADKRRRRMSRRRWESPMSSRAADWSRRSLWCC